MENHRLKLESVKKAFELIDSNFLNSPQFVSKSLSDLLDLELIVKTEILNPIKSFKGRGAEVLASKANKTQKIICASAGNFGQAMAYSCKKRGIEVTVFASKNANKLKVSMMNSFGAEVILVGEDFDEAKTMAKEAANKSGHRFVEDSLDIETLEGTGTIGFELLKLPFQLDAVLISLGNGALTSGIGRVLKELSPKTKVIAIQSDGASAMVESIKSGQLITHDKVDTISDGIAIRLPIPQALEDLDGVVDETLLVSDESTIEAMKLIHQHVGVTPEPSAAVGIAAILENRQLFQKKKVATILCGGNLTEEQIKLWLN